VILGCPKNEGRLINPQNKVYRFAHEIVSKVSTKHRELRTFFVGGAT